MISAVDTNILLDILRPNPDFVQDSTDLLKKGISDEGILVISPVVEAEISAHFTDRTMLEMFLDDLKIRKDRLDSKTTWDAGQAWVRYRKSGGKRDRIISDFLIGAHAANQADRLLTRDRGFFRGHFEGLKIVAVPDEW